MNFTIPTLPDRAVKPRTLGLTMVIDKGLALRQAEDLVSVCRDYIDFIKFGWGTSVLTPQLQQKIELYTAAGLNVYFGGTLFEVFIARNAFHEYIDILNRFQLKFVEVSDGSLHLPIEEKTHYIRELCKHFHVISEVGSKDANRDMAPYLWVRMMKAELDAGATWVIAESRESGKGGIYLRDGSIKTGLIDEILDQVPFERIIFEAPLKEQQVWFIKQLGTNVNLGNVSVQDIISVETLRLGLRGDTFHTFLKP